MSKTKKPTCHLGHTMTQGKDRQFCQVCKNAATKRWKDKNLEKYNEMRRESSLKSDFGITIEQYNEQWNKQKGLCAACKEPLPEKDFGGRRCPIDHNHKTGKLRGIVHTKCNRGMGLFNDNPDRMRRVAQYLEDSDG